MKDPREEQRDNFINACIKEVNDADRAGDIKELEKIAGMLRYMSFMCLQIASMAEKKYQNRITHHGETDDFTNN